MKELSVLQIMLRGMAMGIAEVIPGVSGGTIAFITGIYERLINAISGVGPKLGTAYKEGGIAGVFNALDGFFLVKLVAGMFLGIVVGAFTVSKLLTTYPEPLWAFFFGLIIASVLYVLKQIENFDWKTWMAFGIGAMVAYAMTAMYPISGSSNLLYVFFCGMIAISALILPGVSGSFMLLVLGMYTLILGSVKNFLSGPNGQDFLLLAVFGFGCLAGLMTFSKVVSYFFKNYKTPTLAVLAGFMIGSIHKIWPWRNPIVIFDKEASKNISVEYTDNYKLEDFAEKFKVIIDQNVFPEQYFSQPNTSLAVMAGVAGFFLVFILSRIEK